jgi:hypothetical protein
MPNACGASNIMPDDEQMLSPSKLAAQRIYSTARKSISFNDALRGSSDTACSPPSSPPLVSAPACQRLPQQRRPSSPTDLEQRPRQQVAVHDIERNHREDLKQLLHENARQFRLVQQQIDTLRSMLVQLASERQHVAAIPPQTPLPPPAPLPPTPQAPTPLPPQAQSAAPLQLQSTVIPKPLHNVVVEHCGIEINVWQTLIFAVVFLIGLVRIIEWLVEKICHLLGSSSKAAKEAAHSSESSTSCKRRPRYNE